MNAPDLEHSADLFTEVEASASSARTPTHFALGQNFPNPFNAQTTISFALPRAADLQLTIFNATGQMIRKWEGSWPAGHQQLTWNGQDQHGIPVASGIYFYHIQSGSYTETKWMALLK